MSEALPPRVSLEHLKKQAKDLLRAYGEKDPDAVERFRSLSLASGMAPRLAHAQRLIARQYGFASWAKLKVHAASAAKVAAVQARREKVRARRT